MRRPASINLAIAIQLLVGIAVIAYWAAWFAAPELVRARAPGAADYSIYVAFEGAFLLPDGWVAVASLAGAAGLWLMRDWGLLLTLLGAGAGVFLGLIDLLYDLEHGMYVPLSGNAALKLAIIAGLLILCPLSAYLAWQQSHALRARSSGRASRKAPSRRRPRRGALRAKENRSAAQPRR